MKEKNINSLEHTKWRCQYHIVFAPKYRRMTVYGEIKKDIGQILRKLREQKGVRIIEAEASPDHIHITFDYAACTSWFIVSPLSDRHPSVLKELAVRP